MQLRLDLFLAKCDIDYDSIIFINDCFVFSYTDLVNRFDIKSLCVFSFYLDGFDCFIVVFGDRYINYP